MSRSLYILMGGLVAVAILVIVLTLPDHRTAGQRVGDAVDALPHGVDKAADQLRDRSPAEKAGDAIQQAGDKSSKVAKDLTR